MAAKACTLEKYEIVLALLRECLVETRIVTDKNGNSEAPSLSGFLIYFDIPGTDYYVRLGNTGGYGYVSWFNFHDGLACSLEEVLDHVPDDLKDIILFNLELFNV